MTFKRILICSKCGLHYGSDKRRDNRICPYCIAKQIKEERERIRNVK
jgi:predicted Zn-ribbon and HTH transcriptional regulator